MPTSDARTCGCRLQGADLAGADLTGADLAGADLTKANLRGAILDGTSLIGATLTGVDFSSAVIRRLVLNQTRFWTRPSDSISSRCRDVPSDPTGRRRSTQRSGIPPPEQAASHHRTEPMPRLASSAWAELGHDEAAKEAPSPPAALAGPSPRRSLPFRHLLADTPAARRTRAHDHCRNATRIARPRFVPATHPTSRATTRDHARETRPTHSRRRRAGRSRAATRVRVGAPAQPR